MSLVAENISYAYPGGAELYRGLSLEVGARERVALVAPSGRGKTTLCRILAGHLKPQGGRVLVDGEPLFPLRHSLRRHSLGPRPVQLLAQHPEQAFDPLMRLSKSLAEAAPIETDEASELFKLFGVRAVWLARLPHELSGGELMRLAMVRALLARPRYLVADESTAMLDAVTQAEIWRALIGLADDRAMGLIVVSHSPALLARVATREVRLP